MVDRPLPPRDHRRCRWLGAVLSAAACSAPPPASSPAVPVGSDRPSFSTGTALAPRGHVLLETGATFGHDARPGATASRVVAPELLVRHALNDRVELRVGHQGFARRDAGGPAAEGAADGSLGAKVLLQDETALVPCLGLELGTSLGVGARDLGANSADPFVRALWSRTLGAGCAIGGNLVVAFPHGGDGRFTQGAASVYGTWTPGGGTTLFAELFVVDPVAGGGDEAWATTFGVLRLLGERVQLDARLGVGLDGDAEDLLAGVGITWLLGGER